MSDLAQISFGTAKCGHAGQIFKTGLCAHCYIAELELAQQDGARYRSMRADVVSCNAGGSWPTWIGARTGAEVDQFVDRNIQRAAG